MKPDIGKFCEVHAYDRIWIDDKPTLKEIDTIGWRVASKDWRILLPTGWKMVGQGDILSWTDVEEKKGADLSVVQAHLL